jgi:hypothetical protein
LSVIWRRILRGSGERVAVFVGHAGQVELEREALLHPVARGHGLHVDEVQRLLGGADHPGVLGGDVAGHPQRGLVEVGAGHHLVHGAEVVQGVGVDGGGGEEQPPHHVLRDQPGQVGGRAQAPRSTSGRPNLASSEATMTSALPTSPMPPPTQNPLTAATTGTAHS